MFGWVYFGQAIYAGIGVTQTGVEAQVEGVVAFAIAGDVTVQTAGGGGGDDDSRSHCVCPVSSRTNHRTAPPAPVTGRRVSHGVPVPTVR